MALDRRSFLQAGLASFGALGLARVAVAQDPRETVVQATARAWLERTDRLDGPGSYRAAAAKFKGASTEEQWSVVLKQIRGPLGKTEQRAIVGTSFSREFPGAPPGEYALVECRTAFEKKTDSHETLTLEREPDGQWRVVGYFLR